MGVRVLTLGVLPAVVAGLFSVGTPGTAGADPLASARERARALSAQVADLDQRAEVATEAMNAVEERLGAVVSGYLTASQTLDQLTTTQNDNQAEAGRRVRALYMAGGELGLYAAVLNGGDLSDLVDRMVSVNRVLSSDRATIADASRQVERTRRTTAQLNALAAERTQLEAEARAKRDQVVSLLAQRSAELASATAEVQRLVAEQQRQAEVAAAAQTAAQLGLATAVPPLPPSTPPVVVAAVTAARTKLGVPYLWGATGPDAFDCSGLVQWAYAQAGLTLPRVAAEQWSTGPHPALDQLQPGDLLFWAYDTTDPSTIHHVALYVGGGYMEQAPHTGDVVRITPVYLDGYIGATRPWQ